VREAPYERHLEILRELRAAAPPSVDLRLGWEIMLDVPGADLSPRHLSLDGSGATLVEFQRNGLPPNSIDELFRLRANGVVPVVAHPQRYWGCTLNLVREWRSVGAVMQLDPAGIRSGRSEGRRLALGMLEAGLCDVLASDNHGDSRSIARGRDWLLEIGAQEQAEILTRVNPQRLLAGEELESVPPIEFRSGMLERLRRFMLGGRRPSSR
jgi:protein-tyrosine phosphatase